MEHASLHAQWENGRIEIQRLMSTLLNGDERASALTSFYHQKGLLSASPRKTEPMCLLTGHQHRYQRFQRGVQHLLEHTIRENPARGCRPQTLGVESTGVASECFRVTMRPSKAPRGATIIEKNNTGKETYSGCCAAIKRCHVQRPTNRSKAR